jgi:hypothetical protein
MFTLKRLGSSGTCMEIIVLFCRKQMYFNTSKHRCLGKLEFFYGRTCVCVLPSWKQAIHQASRACYALFLQMLTCLYCAGSVPGNPTAICLVCVAECDSGEH